MKIITLNLPITPNPQLRTRARAYVDASGRARARVYKKAEALRNEDDFFYLAVNSEIRPKEPLKGPIHIRLKASLPRPKSVKRRGHVVKPDLDNLVKFALDCLTRAGYWEDDKQIVAIDAWKRYASSFATVGWHIEILNIDERTIA